MRWCQLTPRSHLHLSGTLLHEPPHRDINPHANGRTPSPQINVLVMGSFGDTVTSLVDTYTRCLAALEGFGRGKQPDESSSRLRRALRKARGKVRRVYSSKLSHGGSSFEKGDGEY